MLIYNVPHDSCYQKANHAAEAKLSARAQSPEQHCNAEGLAGEGGKSSLTALCSNNVVAKGSKDCSDGLSATDIC